jgi:hypothetical protein
MGARPDHPISCHWRSNELLKLEVIKNAARLNSLRLATVEPTCCAYASSRLTISSPWMERALEICGAASDSAAAIALLAESNEMSGPYAYGASGGTVCTSVILLSLQRNAASLGT